MILLVAVLCGVLAGWAWARTRRRPYQAPPLRATWLIVAGFIPQVFVAYLPATHWLLPAQLAALGLWASLLLLLAFVWINRRLPGMPVMLAGLTLNLIVMAANGGWMPITPNSASQVLGRNVAQYVAIGDRFGQKDILLRSQDTHLGLLADRFLLPAWSPYRAAFSAGDILIAAGVFWLLVKPPVNNKHVQVE